MDDAETRRLRFDARLQRFGAGEDAAHFRTDDSGDRLHLARGLRNRRGVRVALVRRELARRCLETRIAEADEEPLADGELLLTAVLAQQHRSRRRVEKRPLLDGEAPVLVHQRLEWQ